MSPEQLKSSKTVDVRSDIWSLGVVLYELVSGRKPFHGESITELALTVAMDPTPPLAGGVPPIVRAGDRCVASRRIRRGASRTSPSSRRRSRRSSGRCAARARVRGGARGARRAYADCRRRRAAAGHAEHTDDAAGRDSASSRRAGISEQAQLAVACDRDGGRRDRSASRLRSIASPVDAQRQEAMRAANGRAETNEPAGTTEDGGRAHRATPEQAKPSQADAKRRREAGR